MPATRPVPDGFVPGGRFDAWLGTTPAYVVCDVDGTLVNRATDASAAVADAVSHAQGAGLRVGLATGRMRRATDSLIAQVGARGPHVFHNGAEVRDGDVLIASWDLAPEHVDALLALVRDRDDAYVEIYTDDAYLASSLDERASAHWEMLGHRPAGTIGAASHIAGTPVRKATVVGFSIDAATATSITERIVGLGMAVGSARSPRTPWLEYLNVTHPDADKGRAAVAAADALGVALAEVAAVGDDTNDLPLFARVGTAVAMGQADAAVRAGAHLVAPSADDDGAARALELLARWRAQELPGTM